ncbi:efflux transporter outer membrane subunit [Variovorax paradoxus]|uniref:efflux transporter outer membrane subunit n=1 Tax=Variovorax paradoxus TaxID=34073 RepID=UPI0019313E7C|nr:efflux transporter outer membrane subunit [Variovorax paradoxus]
MPFSLSRTFDTSTSCASPHRWRAGVLVGALVAAGCAAPPESAERAVPLPVAWRAAALPLEAPAVRAASAAAPDAQWWRGFGSGELDALIDEADAGSHDLAMALARVQAARAQARVAGAARWPVLSANVDASREGRLGGQGTVEGSRHLAGFAARYELDLWGRQAALGQEGLQGWRASVFDRDAVRVGLRAEVASSWLRLRGLRERAAIAHDSLDNARRLLRLVSARHAAGAATPLELAQQRGLVAARERELAAMRQRADDAVTELALLRGLDAIARPGDAAGGDATRLAQLRIPPVDPGLPSQLLVRRPDIARSEARLAAADQNVHAARAALLPSVSLGAMLGGSGSGTGGWFGNPLYRLTAGIAAPLFDGGRLAGERELAEARRAELLQSYRAAIAAALSDAQTALGAVSSLDAQALAQAEELNQARRAETLAESRYRAGAETLLVLLDAQRTLHEARDREVQLMQARLEARVALYRALGGGWRAGASDTALADAPG